MIPPITGYINEINFIPFYGDINILEIILSIILFIPFGIYLSMITNHRNTENVLIGLIFIVILESSEHLLGTGVLDITDIITNTFGVYIGRLSYNLSSKFLKKEELDKIILLTAFFCTIAIIIFLYFKYLMLK